MILNERDWDGPCAKVIPSASDADRCLQRDYAYDSARARCRLRLRLRFKTHRLGACDMTNISVFYATTPDHVGKDRWNPTAYGPKFSDDGMENLRFGRASLEADDAEIERCLGRKLGPAGQGDGERLCTYLTRQAEKAQIRAYREAINRKVSDRVQPSAKLGSSAMFEDIQQAMMRKTDVLVLIHGFNVRWAEAVGTAAALEIMMNRSPAADPEQDVAVVLFTWPSDGLAMPFASYKSDRTEAEGSGYAVGRAFLKVRDFLAGLRDRARRGGRLCGQDIHLLCHSMGNFVLQAALTRIGEFTPGTALPRLFEHIFLCAPDVDDDVLEPGHAMGAVHELARAVTVYHNRGDVAMVISDHTKGHPERLGAGGAARPSLLHNKVHQVDCTPIVSGLVEHCYYLSGHIRNDIRQSIDGTALDDPRRLRLRDPNLSNVWTMKW
jgi:esterase/lipase superfamily enzyme